MKYDLELDNAVDKIKKENAGTVCIQLPFGLRNKAVEIVSYLEKNTDTEVFIWLGSCFGACDFPNLDVDLLIQWGHSKPGSLS